MTSNKNRPIGVFDSGIGGLTVLKEIAALLPGEDTVYLGDTARVPYGNKSAETVIRYAVETADFLMSKKIKLLVVACNTASSVSLPTLKARCRVPVLGVIEPGAKKATEATKTGRVGVIGTERTIKSRAYTLAINNINPRIRIFSQPCPLFVPLVEEGLAGSEIAFLAAKRYLKDVRAKKLDALVLGCTHYPLLKTVIRRAVGKGIFLVDSAKETAAEVSRVLTEMDLKKNDSESGKGKHVFYVTDHPERFVEVGRKFLGKELKVVKQVGI